VIEAVTGKKGENIEINRNIQGLKQTSENNYFGGMISMRNWLEHSED